MDPKALFEEIMALTEKRIGMKLELYKDTPRFKRDVHSKLIIPMFQDLLKLEGVNKDYVCDLKALHPSKRYQSMTFIEFKETLEALFKEIRESNNNVLWQDR